MIDISLAGLVGAIIGTAIAAVAYAPLVEAIERRLRTRSAGDDDIDRSIMRQEISLLRRGVFAADVAVFAGLGYWLAAAVVNR
ncbi:MAG TPA: hypothetical protein VH678_22330 [Xanthobacteraceae bacterium]|jgi:hypothetical protein